MTAALPESPFHRGSHDDLLVRVPAGQAPAAQVDAILVPAARPAGNLAEAAGLGAALNRPVVAFCSRAARPAEAAAEGAAAGADMWAVDVGHLPALPAGCPPLRTMAPLDGPFRRRSDLSLKRNLGLLLARLAGWRRVLFLDDDVARVTAADVRAAAGLLDAHPVTGLHIDTRAGGPDNSVVCIAYRETGGAQGGFIGGGALAVAPDRLRSFFPDIYCEDWFVYYDVMPVAETGRVVHRRQDPFADPDRARAEELGDCLAEGLFWLREDPAWRGRYGSDPAAFWAHFLGRRRTLLATVRDGITALDLSPTARDRRLAAVAAAQRCHDHITPELCVDYIRAWRADIETWQEHLAGLPTGLPLESALKELDLAGRRCRSW